MRTNKIISALSNLLHSITSVLSINESRQNDLFMESDDYKTPTEI
jgi:hypothetical protein